MRTGRVGARRRREKEKEAETKERKKKKRKSKSNQRQEKKINKIINASAIVTVHICTITITIVHLCTFLHLGVFALWYSAVRFWIIFSIARCNEV